MSDGGGLDDLFSLREEPAVLVEDGPPVPKRRSRALWVLRNLALVACTTVVVVAMLRYGGYHMPLLLVITSLVALRLILLAVYLVKPPPLPKSRNSGRGDDSRAETFDSLRAAVRRWEKTLTRAHNDPDLYTRNVLPALAELTDERLRLRHGITRATDPRRARELIGDPLWAALHDRGRRTPKARDLESYVEVLERL